MRLGGRVAAAIEVLADMETRQRMAGDALKDWGRSHRFAGAGDRSAIGNIVYDALRRKRSSCWLFGDETPRSAALGALILESGTPAEELSEQFETERFGPGALTEAEIAASDPARLAEAPDAIRSDAPDWCLPMLQRSFGDNWVEETAALAGRPPLDLRANRLRKSRDQVASVVEATEPTKLSPFGLRLPPILGSGRHPNVQAHEAFLEGWFEIQDEGSQIAALLAGARPGMQVLDLCAGAGGKTLAMSAEMENSGQIFAWDSDATRLQPIHDRLKRANTRNVQVLSSESSLNALTGTADLVLVDAPCTGSGTWRRRPDAKWRLTDRQLAIRVAEQSEILDRAATFVKPGGRLAYVTCSVFSEENGDQIEAFLARHPDFKLDDNQAQWTEKFGDATSEAELVGPIFQPHGLLLSPLRTGTDGFFFAGLIKA